MSEKHRNFTPQLKLELAARAKARYPLLSPSLFCSR
jgi:hypothetical protein